MSDIKDKIAKLLAKAERTENEQERDAYNAQAQKLMIRWGIEEAELESAGEIKPEEIVEKMIHLKTSYAPAFVVLGHSVARGMGNLRTLQSKPINKPETNRFLYVIGHTSDVERFEQLLTSLILQVTTARKRWWKSLSPLKKARYTHFEAFVAGREFIVQFGLEVGARLRALHQEEDVQASPGAALVLASKQTRVDGWVEEKYPNLQNVRGYTSTDYTGARAGREAGRLADIGQSRVSGGGRAIQS